MVDAPHIAQKAPYVVEVTPGRYAWCACGRSQSQPYCDGSHRGTDLSPVLHEVTQVRRVAWCGCKQSASKPFCDGSHNRL